MKKKKYKDDPLSETISLFFLSQKNLQVILADTVDSQLAKNMAVFVTLYLFVIAIIMIIIFSASFIKMIVMTIITQQSR